MRWGHIHFPFWKLKKCWTWRTSFIFKRGGIIPIKYINPYSLNFYRYNKVNKSLSRHYNPVYFTWVWVCRLFRSSSVILCILCHFEKDLFGLTALVSGDEGENYDKWRWCWPLCHLGIKTKSKSRKHQNQILSKGKDL